MKTTVRDSILEALQLKNLKERYKALVKLLLNLATASSSQKRYYNATSYDANTLATLEYDIKKLANISDQDVKRLVRKAKKEAAKAPILTGEERLLAIDPEAPREILLQEAIDLKEFSKLDEFLPGPLKQFTKGIAGVTEQKEWLAEKEVKHELTKKAELQELIEQVYNKMVEDLQDASIKEMMEFRERLLTEEKTTSTEDQEKILLAGFAEANDDVKTHIKLRDEFPFLNDKDCPDKFKILVADKLTAYNEFRDSRAEIKNMLEAGASEEDIFALAKTAVENFELNLEIYDELNYYKEHGEIKGDHEIFADDVLKEKVEKMSTMELTKRQKNLRTYISRDSKKLDKMEAGDEKDKFQEKYDGFQNELNLINARLEKIS